MAPRDHLRKANYYGRPIALSAVSFPLLMAFLLMGKADLIPPGRKHWHRFRDPEVEKAALVAAELGATNASSWFWVGGTGTWDGSTTTHWASTSGGAGSAGVPGSADTAVFDSNSGTGIATISAGAICANLTCNGSTAGSSGNYTGTLAGSAAMNIGGVLALVSGMTLTYTGTWTFTAGSSKNVTTGGNIMPPCTFNGSGGAWVFQDAFSTAATSTLTLTQGTLNTNNQTCSWGFFTASGTTARTLTLGSSVITLNGVAGIPWNTNTSTNLTFNAGTSTIQTAAANLSNAQYEFGSLTYSSIIIQADTHSTTSVSGSFTCTNFTYAPSLEVAVAGNFDIRSHFTVTGTLTFTGQAAPYVPIVQSLTLGTAMTITCNGTVTLTGRMDFADIAGAGTATWNFATGGGDAGGNSGITFATPQTNYYFAAASGNWSVAANWFLATGGTGGAGRVPFPQDSCVLDANSGVHTYTIDCPRIGGTLTCTGFSGIIASSVATTIFGSLTFSSTMTRGTWTTSTTFASRSSCTYTSAGLTNTPSFIVNAPGTSLSLQDSFTTANGFIITNGTLTKASGATIGILQITCAAAGTWNLNAGTWNISGTGIIVNVTGTVIAGTGTIVLTDTSVTSKTFAGGGQTYGTLQITGSSGGVIISGANTFTAITEAAAGVLTLTSSVTQTIASGGSLSLNGVTLNSTTPGTAATISAPSGATILVSNTAIKDNTATGTGAPFTATGTSTLVSNTTNWVLGFAGSAASASNASGSLGAVGLMASSASSTSQCVGSLAASGPLAGTAESQSSSTGSLTATGSLSGTSASSTSGIGTISATATLSGSAASTSTATGSLVGTAPLLGSAGATSTGTGAIGGKGFLSAGSPSASSAAGTLSFSASLHGIAQAFTTAAGSLTATASLSGTAQSVSTANGSMSARADLSATAASTSLADGAIFGTASLSASAGSQSSCNGGLGGQASLIGASSATVYAVGDLSAFGDLSGSALSRTEATGTFRGSQPFPSGKASSKSFAAGELAAGLPKPIIFTSHPRNVHFGTAGRVLVFTSHPRTTVFESKGVE